MTGRKSCGAVQSERAGLLLNRARLSKSLVKQPLGCQSFGASQPESQRSARQLTILRAT